MQKKLEKLYDLIHQANYPGDADRNVCDILEDAEELCTEIMCNQKVYIVWWCNGETYRQDVETEIIGVFSSKEDAESYRDNWRDEYRKKCEAIATEGNYQQKYSDYSFEFYFPEVVWMKEYDLQ